MSVSVTAIHAARRAMRGRLLLIVSAIAFSTAGLFARAAPVDPWAMVFWRNIFGCAALLPLIVATEGAAPWRVIPRLGPFGWATIAASSAATICFLTAFAHASVAHVSIIYATAPLLTAVIAWAWLGETATRRTLSASLIALIGVAVTVGGSLAGGSLLGDGLALAMTVCMSLMTIFARRHGRLPALPTAFLTSLVAALAVLPLGWASGGAFAVTWEQAAWLALFGVTTMGVALPCYLWGAARVRAGQAMLISALEMPFAPLWVWLAFAEIPSGASILGGGLVAVAILWQLTEAA